MKIVSISFEKKEYEELLFAKGKYLSWKEFILKCCLNSKNKNNESKKDNELDLLNGINIPKNLW